MNLRLVTWNLFHGRDCPPDPKLFPWWSKWLRITARGEEYAQVNRSLRAEFTEVLRRLEWDVAFLQEARPRWHDPLRRDLGVQGASALTSRNSFAPVRALLAAANPDVVKSNEGGSNQLLVRAPWKLGEVRTHVITTAPERRVMMFAPVEAPDGRSVAVANLHGSVDSVPGAREQVIEAAGQAVEWAGDLPLVFGGDLNLRMSRQEDLFATLGERYGLAPPTSDRTAIDHLLMRGLEVVEAPHRLPDEAREVPADGLRLQLSDHRCVAAVAGMK